MFTSRTPARLVGEIAALLLVCVGFLSGVVALATIPKYGSRNIFWPALVGIVINGLLLAIAIPNFLHARKLALEGRKPDWIHCQLAGLEFLSPMALTNDNNLAALRRGEKYLQLTEEQKSNAEENMKRLESYHGQLADVSIGVSRTTLLPDQNQSIDGIVTQIRQAMQQQFSRGFQSVNHDVMIGGSPAKRMTLQFEVGGRSAKVEYLFILKHPYFWQFQMFGPADRSSYDETVEKILASIKISPN